MTSGAYASTQDWHGLTTFHLHDSADRILADIAGEEELSNIDFKGSTLTEEFALVTMIGKTIKGLPNDAPPELRQAIVNAAQTRRAIAARPLPPINLCALAPHSTHPCTDVDLRTRALVRTIRGSGRRPGARLEMS
jgi:hypothetical protein